MSSYPRIKVELQYPDTDIDGIWVTYVPVRREDLAGVLDAVGEAFTFFTAGLVKDEKALEERFLSTRDLAAR